MTPTFLLAATPFRRRCRHLGRRTSARTLTAIGSWTSGRARRRRTYCTSWSRA